MSEFELNELINRIKTRRQELGLSYQDLSDLTGISKSTLQRYETGFIKKVPITQIEIIAKALNISPGYLMGWDEEAEKFKAGKTDEEVEETSENILSYIYNSLSEKGQKKFLDYLNDLQNNPENVDPNTYVREVFLNNLNDEALRKRKELAKELHIQNKYFDSIARKSKKE